MGDWMKGKSEEEQKKMYEQQTSYTKERYDGLVKAGVPDAVNMLHKGYIYVFLGKK